jgi:hypothetical protein
MSSKFSSENQPAKKGVSGGWFKKKLIESLKRQGMTEEGFIDLLVVKAIEEGGVFMTELLKRYSPITKQTFEALTIEGWPKDGTPIEKAEVILNSMACGDIPPDLGSLFIDSISKSLGIEEITELAKRLEAIEAIINDKK